MTRFCQNKSLLTKRESKIFSDNRQQNTKETHVKTTLRSIIKIKPANEYEFPRLDDKVACDVTVRIQILIIPGIRYRQVNYKRC